MHQKKSELQIGTESRGVSSDFTRTPPLHHHHHHHDPFSLYDALNSPTPHKRAGTANAANPGTMNSTPSSLSRSPTLSSLLPTTTTAISTRNQFHHHPQFTIKPSATVLRFLRRLSAHHHYYHHQLKPRLLLPPSLVFAVPAFWYLLRNSNSPSSSFGLWFDFVAALAFAGALVLSFHLSFPRLSLSLAALLRERPRPRFAHSPPVKWTIGSKPISKKPVSADDKEGVVVYSNGDVYEGEFHQGKCSGSGVYYYCMSGRYEGDWVDEKYDGYGVETWARGSRYRGQYRQGLRHGYGVYKFYTGDVYAGEWSNGQSHGYGVHTCEDGSRYVGEFKWGVKHGLGHYHFRNGDTYAGEYFADKMHGFGVYRFANGHRYEGSWHEGRKQGLGMYTFRNGDTHSGCWHNGTLETPSTQSTHPGSPVAVNHSKVLNAVQEARRAAEKAYEVPRVDERVNRAVAAANRAANAARVAAVKAVQKRMDKNDNEYFASEMV